VVLMALVAVDCLVKKPKWPRGMLVGLAAAIKLTPAAFLLFFLLRRDYRATVTGILSFLAATGIGFLLAWDSSVKYWSSTLFDTGRVGAPHYTSNQTIMAVLARLGIESATRNALWLLLSLVVLALAVVGIRRAFAASRDTMALTLNAFAALLVSPVSWSHHWVWGIPAVLTLAVVGLRNRAQLPIGLATTGAVLFLVSPHSWLPSSGDRELRWAAWQQVVGSSYVYFAAAVLILAAFAKSLWREHATDNPVDQASTATAEISEVVAI
jgi:alpha-1,2-mannosyltransferase